MHCWTIFILIFFSIHCLNTPGKNSPKDSAAWLPPKIKIFNSLERGFFVFLKFNISSLIMLPVVTTLGLNFALLPQDQVEKIKNTIG